MNGVVLSQLVFCGLNHLLHFSKNNVSATTFVRGYHQRIVLQTWDAERKEKNSAPRDRGVSSPAADCSANCNFSFAVQCIED